MGKYSYNKKATTSHDRAKNQYAAVRKFEKGVSYYGRLVWFSDETMDYLLGGGVEGKPLWVNNLLYIPNAVDGEGVFTHTCSTAWGQPDEVVSHLRDRRQQIIAEGDAAKIALWNTIFNLKYGEDTSIDRPRDVDELVEAGTTYMMAWIPVKEDQIDVDGKTVSVTEGNAVPLEIKKTLVNQIFGKESKKKPVTGLTEKKGVGGKLFEAIGGIDVEIVRQTGEYSISVRIDGTKSDLDKPEKAETDLPNIIAVSKKGHKPLKAIINIDVALGFITQEEGKEQMEALDKGTATEEGQEEDMKSVV